MMRSPEEFAARVKAAQQQQAQAQQAEIAEKMAKGAQTLSQTDVGAGQSALQLITGGA